MEPSPEMAANAVKLPFSDWGLLSLYGVSGPLREGAATIGDR